MNHTPLTYVSMFRKFHWLSDCAEFNHWTSDVVVPSYPGSAQKVTCLDCLDYLANLGQQ